jgi:hypothetical protein
MVMLCRRLLFNGFFSVASVPRKVLGPFLKFQPVQLRLGRKRPCEIPFLDVTSARFGGVEGWEGAILGSTSPS